MTKTNLVEGRAFELDPAKKYLILFDDSTIQRDDLKSLNRMLVDKLGVKNLIVSLRGNPKNVKIVEATPDATE